MRCAGNNDRREAQSARKNGRCRAAVWFEPRGGLEDRDRRQDCAEPFDPAGYRDEYWEVLMEVIEAKLQGQELLESPPAPRGTVDLTAALRASVEAAKKQRAASTRPPSRQRAPAA